MEAVDEFIEGRAGKLAVRAKGLDQRPRSAIVMVQGALLPSDAPEDPNGFGTVEGMEDLE